MDLKDEAQMSALRLRNKTAIVTGGASGIGRAIALRFAREGARVHVLDVAEDAARKVVQEIEKGGGKAAAHRCDSSGQSNGEAFVQKLSGEKPFQILVNNAGVSHSGKLETTSETEFDRIFSVNVKGIYNCMRAAVETLKANGGGAIVNMASVAATAGLADRFAYSMSKGAVVAMTLSVARDYLP